MIVFIVTMFLCALVFFVLMWREFVKEEEINYFYLILWFAFSLIFGCSLGIYIVL